MARRPSAIAPVLMICAVMSSITCDRSPTAASLPPGPAPPTVTGPVPTDLANVSGTVWIHDAGAVKPYAGAKVYGWVQTAHSGRGTGPAVADADGTYQLRVPVGSILRIALDWPPPYQPCAVVLAVAGDTTRAVHAVSDPRQLGAGLPQQLLSQSPTLSGVVFEATREGPRALGDIRVELDNTGGGDWPHAITLTNSDGRYVFCGLEVDTSTYISASRPGYQSFSKRVVLTGNATTFDIELGPLLNQ